MRAEHDILLLAADGNAIALCDADGDDFCKRLGAVAQLMVDFPHQYRVLLGVLASNADKDDYDIVTGKAQPDPAREMTRGSNSDFPSRGDQRLLDARSRVRLLVVQAMAAFQLRNAWWWGGIVKAASFVVSLGLAFVALEPAEGEASSKEQFVARAAMALLAAFLAPVARDLVATIEKLRSN